MRKSISLAGFTLLELMIVVTVIGLLAVIAIPRYGQVLTKANDGATKGNLGAIRSAVTIYYADMEGIFPTTLASLTVNGKFMSSLPKTRLPLHQGSSDETNSLTDAGGWGYTNSPSAADFGSVWVNCSHTDTKGGVWSTY